MQWVTLSRDTIRDVLVVGFLTIGVVFLVNTLLSMFDTIHAQDYPPVQTGDIFVDKLTLGEREQAGLDLDDELRHYVLSELLATGFSGFVKSPYPAGVTGVVLSGGRGGELMIEPIEAGDQLDLFVGIYLDEYRNTQYQVNKKPFYLSMDEVYSRDELYLWRSKVDLDRLGYEVVSHRSRVNTDDAYRRHNISTALAQLSTPRVMLPGESLHFLDAINYDPLEKELYQDGYVVIDDEEQPSYGGGLCGASTALYQGILTNKGLGIDERRAHTKWYDHLYVSHINGEEVSIPGIDSTVFDGHIDLVVTNTRPYPLVLVAIYDGSYEGVEQVFTLGRSEDVGSFSHLDHWPNQSVITVDGKKIHVQGGCYMREVNGSERRSCYKEVK